MLKRKQLIGANFSFQHHPFRWTAEKLSGMGFQRMEFWGVAPHLDLFHDNRARLAEVRAILGDNGLTVHCFTPEQVLYPINIASGDSAYRAAEIEAARACGMSTLKAYRLVILPRAFSICLPAYSNEVIILLKGTSLASTITLMELTGASRLAASNTYQPIEVFAIAGVVYYLLTLIITKVFQILEARYNRYITHAR